jgi:hypothetical protein
MAYLFVDIIGVLELRFNCYRIKSSSIGCARRERIGEIKKEFVLERMDATRCVRQPNPHSILCD